MLSVLNRFFLMTITVLALFSNAFGWSCETHTYIALEAGMKNPETACLPDLAREENKSLLGPLHWHDAAPNTVVTPSYIDKFKIVEAKYVKVGSPDSKPITINVPDPSGVLYWKIVELYEKMRGATGWIYDYYLCNIAHYVGDLSQPLHNFAYDEEPASDGKTYPEIGAWAKENHGQFDSVLDSYLPLAGEEKIHFQALIVPVQIMSVDDLKTEISKIANSAIGLANRCYSEKGRIITKEEALRQIAMSVSLLKGIIANTNKGR